VNWVDPKVLNVQANASFLLSTALEVEGAKGVALADYRSGDCLYIESRIGNGVKIAVMADSAIIRAKLDCLQQLGITDSMEEVLISLNNEYHLIRLVKKYEGLFLYYMLDRSQVSLALGRLLLSEIEDKLIVGNYSGLF
jgi:hypothetical protein